MRTTSTLHGYKIDPDKGTLTAIGKWPTEKTPRGFNIDPRGKFLLSVGMDSAGMTVHAIDPTSGELEAGASIPDGHAAELGRDRRLEGLGMSYRKISERDARPHPPARG